MDGLVPVVSAQVNGRDARFIADSGAFFSVMSPDAARKLGVKVDPGSLRFEIAGVNGSVSAQVGEAQQLVMAGRTYRKVQFVVAATGIPSDVDGLFGQNVLGAVDAEYDLANGAIRIFSPLGCGNLPLAYWAAGQPIGVLDIAGLGGADQKIVGEVLINGQKVRAQFDTGSATSLLTLQAARRLKLDLNATDVSGAGPTYGIAARGVETRSVPIASFQIDQETITNTRLRVAPSEMSVDMLIGADFFLSHRVFVARSQRKLYFTYNGGPVFRLFEPDAAPPPKGAPAPATAATPATLAQATASSASGATASAGDPPADAGVLDRRARASLARGAYQSAIADFGRAIALEPNDARHYVGRARARLALRQTEPATADLDQALKLDPNLVDALVPRGALYLAAKDEPRAHAMFDAALKAAPKESDVQLSIAESYGAAKLFEPAIANLDAWIGAHPNNMLIAEVLNSRCWMRALWGHELDKALADCNLALNRGSRLAHVLDSRGLVHLRLGQYGLAIADYDAALKRQPDQAWSLYGRGLARLKTGDVAGGRADLAAAEARDPRLQREAESYGLGVPAEAAPSAARASQ